MKEEEIILAFVEGFLRQAIEVADEITGGIYDVEFTISKTKVGGTNN